MALKPPSRFPLSTTSTTTTPPTTTTSTIPVPPELEQMLSTLTSHRSVLGYLLLARGSPNHTSSDGSVVPNTSTGTNSPPPSSSSSSSPPPPSSSNRNNINKRNHSRTHSTHASIIRHSGVVFEGEKGKRYAGVIARIVESVQGGLEEIASAGSGGGGSVGGRGEGGGGLSELNEVDEVRFMRIRTRRHEIMISPDDRFILAVLHDPTVT